MNTLTTETRHLIEKLKMAQEIYQRASDTVHNEPMTALFRKEAGKKGTFIEKLNAELNIEAEEVQLPIGDRIRVELEKIRLEIDDILLRLNEGEVLRFCIKRETELTSIYEDLLQNAGSNQSLTDTLQFQLEASKETLRELESIFAPYNKVTSSDVQGSN